LIAGLLGTAAIEKQDQKAKTKKIFHAMNLSRAAGLVINGSK
jgi:hypothetical protein